MTNLNVNMPSGIRSDFYTQRNTFGNYVMNAAPVAANYVLWTLNAGVQANTRIRRICIWNVGQQTTAGLQIFDLVRTTAAFSGGSAFTPQRHDIRASTDQAFSGLVATGNPSITAAGTSLGQFALFVPTATAAMMPIFIDFNNEVSKAITIPYGVLNGIAFRAVTGAAGASGFSFSIDITEEEY